jgi:hypothetical protein
MTTCIDTDDILLVKNDIGSQIKVTLTRDDDNSVINLTNATVLLKVSKFGKKELLYTITAETGVPSFLSAGIAIFTFSQAHLQQSAGRYQGEVEIQFSTGTIETVYELIPITLRNDIE